MRLQEEAGHAVAPFAMQDERNEGTPWSEFFVSNLETKRAVIGIGAVRQFCRAAWSLEAARKFAQLCDAFRPDIIHVHNLYTHLSPSVLAVAKKRGIPVVMTVHDYALVSANYSLWNPRKSQSMSLDDIGVLATAKTRFVKGSCLATLVLEMILKMHHRLRLYDGAIAQYMMFSQFVKGVLVKSDFDEKKMTVMHAFVSSPSLRRRGSGGGLVLFAGRLESYKGVHVLLEALRYLPSTVQVKIAGVGPDEDRLKTMVGRDRRVEFLGFVPGDALGAMMGQAAVVVVPSIWHEPYGLVALEAMSQGTPVIVAKSGGLPEIVGESGAGIVVPPNDPRALARAIESVLDHPEKQESMGKAAQARAEEIADPQAHLAKVMEVYSRCG